MAIKGTVMPAPKPGSAKPARNAKKPVKATPVRQTGREFPKRESRQDAGKIAPGTF